MSSSDMKFYKALDPRLNIGDQIDMAVVKGSASYVPSQRQADSKSLSSIQFNVDIPSLETVIDRKVYIKTSWTASITMKDNATSLNWGEKCGLSAFPFHQIVNTIQLTMNSATTSITVSDWLPVLLRLFEQEDLGHYNSLTPTYLDYFSKYEDAVVATSTRNPFGDYDMGEDNKLQKRGAFRIDSFARAGNPFVYTIKFTTFEPVMISPLVFKSCKENYQGIFGVNTMNLVFNLNVNGNRWFRDGNTSGDITAVSLTSCDSAELYYQFLTPSPDMVLPSQCVVPFYQLQSYIDQEFQINANASAGGVLTVSNKPVVSKNITLNQIPDYLFIWVTDRKTDLSGSGAIRRSDRFAPITNIKINFNNQDGILSGAQHQDLFRYSVDNGLNQSWQEFSGVAQNKESAGALENIFTCGGPVVLRFGKDINIPQAYYAPGSIGNFNILISATVNNPLPVADGAYNGQLMVGVLNTGLMVNSKGATSYYTAVLDKQSVLQANDMEPHTELNRMIGGAFYDNLKTVVKKASKQIAKELPKLEELKPQQDMGAGRTAAGRSAGAMKYRLK